MGLLMGLLDMHGHWSVAFLQPHWHCSWLPCTWKSSLHQLKAD